MTVDDFHPELDRPRVGELVRLIGELDHFRGLWRKLQEIRAERLEQLRQVTTIESTASSTRIEGVELSDAEVGRVLGGLNVDSFRARDQQEVRGYGELLTLIYASSADLTLTEAHVKQLHRVLLRHSEKDERHRGEYKKLANDVVRKQDGVVVEVLFRTASPFDTPRRMQALIGATNRAFADSAHHPLVVIARFIVDFLAVHPFQDGNGRLARALTTLLLLRAGYAYVPYASLERTIEENTQAYYAALRESQHAMRERPAAFGAWLFFFLGALRAQQQALSAKLQVERGLLGLSDVQQRITAALSARGRATAAELAAELALSPRVVRHHLGMLTARGLVAARGERRGRYYAVPGGDDSLPVPSATGNPDRSTNAIVAAIYERGGRISRDDLVALVREHAFDPRTVGVLHARRVAHLRRDPTTQESALTARGEEIARQFLFTARLGGT